METDFLWSFSFVSFAKIAIIVDITAILFAEFKKNIRIVVDFPFTFLLLFGCFSFTFCWSLASNFVVTYEPIRALSYTFIIYKHLVAVLGLVEVAFCRNGVERAVIVHCEVLV